MFLKLTTNDRSDKMFLLTSKFHLQGVVSPCPGAIYMYKVMKKLYKIRLQGSPFITLCLGSIELDCVISEPCNKGIILYRNNRKMTIWEPRPGRVIT